MIKPPSYICREGDLKSLLHAPIQHEMPSWTTLTPLYEEDVLYALDAPSLSRELLGDRASATSSGISRGVVDLLTETEDKVSLMAYLR